MPLILVGHNDLISFLKHGFDHPLLGHKAPIDICRPFSVFLCHKIEYLLLPVERYLQRWLIDFYFIIFFCKYVSILDRIILKKIHRVIFHDLMFNRKSLLFWRLGLVDENWIVFWSLDNCFISGLSFAKIASQANELIDVHLVVLLAHRLIWNVDSLKNLKVLGVCQI